MAKPYMTMAEIEAKYPNKWVLIDDPTTDRYQEVLGGHVVLHCADRAEFLRRVVEWADSGSKHLAVQYVGKFPEEDDTIVPVEPEMARQ